jgi:hypothetical protein
VCSNIALLLSWFRLPHVSYAMLNSGSMPPQSSRIGCRERKLRVCPDVYEGSGPESDLLERDAERDSCASRHGKDKAGLVDSTSASGRTAAACRAFRGDCWWRFRVVWFDCSLADIIDGLYVQHWAGDGRGRAARAIPSSLRVPLMAAVVGTSGEGE